MRLPATTALPLNPTTPSPRAKIEEAARQLESQFAHMLIKSMRATTGGDPLGGSNTTYRDMYDQKLSQELTKGRGLGIAPTIIRQLERATAPAPAAAMPGPLALPGAHSPMAMAVPARSGLNLSLPTSGGGLQLAPTSSGVSMPAVAPLAPFAPTLPPAAVAPTAQAGDVACDPSVKLDCSSPEAFVRSIWPHAQKVAAELNVPPKALVAQAALETSWGRRLPGGAGAATSHNLFGIKAGARWLGQKVGAATHEFVNGVRRNERAAFRAYNSAGESFSDYARLLRGNRYASALGTGNDTHRFASALQKAGYATDPSYANKISAIANGETLNRALAALPGGGTQG
ncbi:MAG: GH73 [uncultured Lysobacter sp.]|uniref:Peptidoglycan hydrolase FlgJ n=1 Tax=uncultured Lysobacter sp. TaxID=271060 RepID=A0A6J4LPL3_9GAMM|nr:MAG: GH73 [uncultured Lysobacter sp.]